ncbi:MAG TPA: hypothetical protein VKV26_06380 [Dehalococcoidia bacterium]|nr:hypothetical protein [Dehalococcoidia bacterium]
MIVERLTFQAKFGQGDTITQAFKEFNEKFAPRYGVTGRLLVDVTGPMFTVVAETEYRDMAHVAETEAGMQAAFADSEWQGWFAAWQGAVTSGSRELLRVVA